MSKFAASYISIRDDSGSSSLSLNEKNFLRQGALSLNSSRILRTDGRSPGEIRKLKLDLSRSHNAAECTVQLGETRISAGIVGHLQPPVSEDRPNEGIVSITVDSNPMASSSFGMMPPLTTTPGNVDRPHFMSTVDDSQKLLGNRILRFLERSILLGGTLDTEALCVEAGAWVWKLSLSVRILDHGGNLLDAALLASMATLRHYRKPNVELVKEGGMPILIHSDAEDPSPLPLNHTPLSVSFALIHADDVALSTSSSMTVGALVDPTEREELVQTGSVSLAMNAHSEVCLLDFGGGCELEPTQLKQCWNLAEKCILKLCEQLEDSLKEADEKAQHERLYRLQKQHQHPNLPPLPETLTPKVPFWHEENEMEIDTNHSIANTSQELQDAEIKAKDREQEEYKAKALEYNLGHVTAKVKETDESKSKENVGQSNLLAAMLKSVQKIPPPENKSDNIKAMDVEAALDRPKADKVSNLQVKESDTPGKSENQKPTVGLKSTEDSDEEVPTSLKSEFAAEVTKTCPATNDEDCVENLASAIKKKKKKKSSKTKKRP
eukprot:CAMPEP_0194169710 /NCGR_PEP_ID=MMETSP0154-20130528/4379_1 /TAXON_ID=1049557 /ORGANISM="Thalassiothrix antarctica, Strain L6-D1" /LENGTH=550 /DNA_ID=CAMNT_0038881241 /DNA_START=10 /DNA_END=1662 /DNA_ORIENTATION=-